MHPKLEFQREVHRVFADLVPEIADGRVAIKQAVFDPDVGVIVAVHCRDAAEALDPVGCCVGADKKIFKAICNRLRPRVVEIVGWNDSPEVFIRNLFSYLGIENISFETNIRRLRVTVRFTDFELFANPQAASRLQLLSEIIGWQLEFVPAQPIVSPSRDDAA